MNRHPRSLACLLACAFAASLPGGARADFLYGIAATLPGIASSELITIDPRTGASSVVGSLGLPNETVNGLASYGGKLYSYDDSTHKVLQVDPSTGHVVASIGIGINQAIFEDALAFRSDGIGFIASSNGNLYSFNLATNTSALVATGLPTNIGGIAFNAGNVLYGFETSTANFFTIDQGTGATHLIGNLGGIHTLRNGMVFAPDGTLYAELFDTLNTINPATAARTLVGPSYSAAAYNISGLGFLPSTVPEPSSVVLLGVGSAGALALSASRRRRAAGLRRQSPPIGA